MADIPVKSALKLACILLLVAGCSSCSRSDSGTGSSVRREGPRYEDASSGALIRLQRLAQLPGLVQRARLGPERTAEVVGMLFSPDAGLLVIGAHVRAVESPGAPVEGVAELSLWDVRRSQMISSCRTDKPARPVGLLAGARKVLCQEQPGALVVWEIPDWKPVVRVGGRDDRFHDVAVASNGLTIAAVVSRLPHGAAHVQIYDAATGQATRALPGEASLVAFAPDARRLAVADARKVTLWDTTGWQKQEWPIPQEIGDARGGGTFLLFSPAGKCLLVKAKAGVWEFGQPRPILKAADFQAQEATVLAGSSLLAAAVKGQVSFWDLQAGARLTTVKGLKHDAVAFAAGANLLAVGARDEVALWEVKTEPRK